MTVTRDAGRKGQKCVDAREGTHVWGTTINRHRASSRVSAVVAGVCLHGCERLIDRLIVRAICTSVPEDQSTAQLLKCMARFPRFLGILSLTHHRRPVRLLTPFFVRKPTDGAPKIKSGPWGGTSAAFTPFDSILMGRGSCMAWEPAKHRDHRASPTVRTHNSRLKNPA